ncbi:tRNA:m4X modification enzyme [Linnemannia elongata]|nr:tRNA:m4X modification enzyme [Linnemannia elongata]
MSLTPGGQDMQKQHPVICQHSIWGSKQQRYRHCKLPAKLSPLLLQKLNHLQQQCFPLLSSSPTSPINEEEHQAKVNEYLTLRTELLQPDLDAHKILCGHHQKEAQAAQIKQDEIDRQKQEGTYQDPEEVKRLAKEQPVDPKDIPEALLDAVERVFSKEPSEWVRRVLDQADGPEDWKMGRSSGRRKRSELENDGDEEELGGVDGVVEKEFPCHESYEGLFSEAGAKKKRHLAQESQLIQSMSTLGLLRPVLEEDGDGTKDQKVNGRRRRPVFVEFGAGTGGLSRHLQLVLETIVATSPTASTTITSKSASGEQKQPSTTKAPEPFNFVLLDRQKFRSRNQVDYMIRTQPRPVKPRVLRITKDVRELTLENLQLIHEVEPGVAWPDWTEGGGGLVKPKEETRQVPTHYLCISKHFCGPATDLALSWMRDQQQLQREEAKEGEERQDLYSICFATCCHGICEPSLVVAKPYLLELLNSSTSLSSSVALKKRKRVESEEHDVSSAAQLDETTTTSEVLSSEQLEAWIPWIIKLTGWATLGKEEESSLVARPGKDATTTAATEEVMTRNERRVLGKRCKKLLDMARCMYLMRECGFRQAKSIEYTTESVESGAIVGTM